MKNTMGEVAVLFSYPKNLILLSGRLLIAYGFAKPALLKIASMEDTSAWFSSLEIPFPVLTAYFVTGMEVIGIVLLILGLFTRFTALILSLIMMGAMFFVHAAHGFSVADNGVEIPLYYMLFLFLIASFGPGKYALDKIFLKGESNE
jgi:putative oxidoreductase